MKNPFSKSNSSIYQVWAKMKQRCQNPNTKAYKHYGARGISVCNSWDKFDNFYADMGDRPTSKHTLERVDNDKGYNKKNCTWATMSIQAMNRRPSKKYRWVFKVETVTYNVGMKVKGKTIYLGRAPTERDGFIKAMDYRMEKGIYTTPKDRKMYEQLTEK